MRFDDAGPTPRVKAVTRERHCDTRAQMDRDDILRLYDAEAVRLRGWLQRETGNRDDIAARLTITPGAVRMRVHRALRKLKGSTS